MGDIAVGGDLLERESILLDIDVLAAAARAGSGGAVSVEGEPGIGKTALLEVVTSRARAAGSVVLSAAGEPARVCVVALRGHVSLGA
jgi:MoxR-like ATPase